jgi:hypothetical protein
MCGACACRGRYLQQLPSSSARHRKDILARCRGRLQQLSRMNTGRTSRPGRRTRSSCAVVPSRHNQRCAKPHAVRFPWRTRGAACAHPGRCMRAALHARTRDVRAPGACAHPGHARIRGMRAPGACARRWHAACGMRAALSCAHPGRARTRGMRAPGACAHPGHARTRGMRAALACGMRHARGAVMRAPGACAWRCAHPGHARGACAHPVHARGAACAHPGRCMRAGRCMRIRTVLPQSPWDVANVRWR